MSWKVSDFQTVNKRWGSYRTLVAKIPIGDSQCWIGLFRENDDHRESISVHGGKEGRQIVTLPFVWVNNDEQKQIALDKIYNKLLFG